LFRRNPRKIFSFLEKFCSWVDRILLLYFGIKVILSFLLNLAELDSFLTALKWWLNNELDEEEEKKFFFLIVEVLRGKQWDTVGVSEFEKLRNWTICGCKT